MNILNYNTELITKYMEQNSMSIAAFARVCNISYESLSNVMKGKSKIRLKTLIALTKVLNVRLDNFLNL